MPFHRSKVGCETTVIFTFLSVMAMSSIFNFGVDPFIQHDRYTQSPRSRQGSATALLNPQKSDLPPEEGTRGWLCVIGAFLTLFCSFGFLNAIGVFQAYYQDHGLTRYTPSDIAWIFSFQLMSMWAPGPLIGRLVDTYGPAPVLYPCAATSVFALFITSFAKEYWQVFIAQGILFGLSAGGVFTSSFICVGQWFVKRRGLGIGIASSGSGFGGVVFPFCFDQLTAVMGFTGAIRLCSLIIAILLVPGCLLITARLPKKQWDSKDRWFEIALFKQPQFALYTTGCFLVQWGLWAPVDFISEFAIQQGFPAQLSLALISIINLTSIPGRILPPYLGDRFGHFNTVTASAFLISTTMLALWLPFDFIRSLAGIIIFSIIYGFVSGSFVSILMPCVAKTGTLETMGMRYGTFQLVIGVSLLTGLPISGEILASQGRRDYWGMQAFAIACSLVGATMILCSTLMLRRVYKTWAV